MTREERTMTKSLKALINSGNTGHVTVHVAGGNIVRVEVQGLGPIQSDQVQPIEAPGVPPLTTREDEEPRG